MRRSDIAIADLSNFRQPDKPRLGRFVYSKRRRHTARSRYDEEMRAEDFSLKAHER